MEKVMLNGNVSEQSRIVTRDEWLIVRKELLEKEKELTRLRDRLSAERRKLPWVRVEKEYVFDTPEGKKTLPELFEGRSQLIIQHFMFGPDWEEGCVGCSFGADHANAAFMHIQHHDVNYVAIARAPIGKLEAFRKRMGWQFKFASSYNSDFNFDFNVSFRKQELEKGKVFYNYQYVEADIEELSGSSVFYNDGSENIYHTYSEYGRGGEEVLSSYMLLDITPIGRNENGPNFALTDWVRHHDKYDENGYVDANGRYVGSDKHDDCCGSH